MQVSIRIAKISDVRSIAEFMKQFETATRFIKVDVEHTTKEYERLVSFGIATLLIMEVKGKMVGGLGFIAIPDVHSGIMSSVETYWFVSPKYRGVGLLLFSAYEKEAIKQGCKRIAMVHLMDSYPEKLCKLYEKRGYEFVEKHYIKEI